MAPKLSEMEAFEVVENKRVPLDDFSMGEDSGWREHDADRVQQLTDIFKAGEYGATTLSIPSVLMGQHGKVLLSREDGRYRINNGRSTTAALKALKREMEDTAARVAGGLPPPAPGGLPPPAAGGLTPTPAADAGNSSAQHPAWAVGRLLAALTEGPRTDFVRYSADDDMLVMSINVARCGPGQVCADELADQGADRSGAQGATPQLFNRTQSSQQKSVNQSGKPSLHNRPASPVASGPPHSRRS